VLQQSLLLQPAENGLNLQHQKQRCGSSEGYKMLNLIVFTFGGVILWSKEPADEVVVNKFIQSTVIEGQTEQTTVFEGKTVRCLSRNDLELVFCAYYPSIAQYRGADKLVADVARIFVAQFGVEDLRWSDLDTEDLKKFGALVLLRMNKESGLFSDGAEKQESQNEVTQGRNIGPESDNVIAPGTSTPDSGRESPALLDEGHQAPGYRKSRRSKKKGGTESPVDSPGQDKAKNKKKMRKWGDDGLADDADPDVVLDYSGGKAQSSVEDLSNQGAEVDMDWGHSTKSGEFVLKDLSTELDNILTDKSSAFAGSNGSKADEDKSQPFSFLRNYIGGKKLTPEDISKASQAMETHLMKKNVAREVAEHLCKSVDKSLVGQTTSSWTSVEATVKAAMTEALRRILTPNTSLDLLHEVEANKRGRANGSGRPYVISVVGVNGVGKSTNLSKIGFWLLQNKYKVLIAACDTFRSGAVEQLEVHVRRLQELTQRIGTGQVEIYKQGYGKDAAVIAQKAIEYAEKQQFDVVLIDTAGRRHNDDRLMSSLEKFGKLANPNKIIMVGEALVGTDSVQQAHNFNAAFGAHRNLDFFLISKCDTVGDMIGTMVNMTFSTGTPVLFVGIGQNYTDLRTLSVDWAVELLMS
jgi:signal recognition particle receptor subunit alpha